MIGQCITQVCRVMGASKVIVSEPFGIRRATVSKLGADMALNPREITPIEAVTEATSGKMANVVFECSWSSLPFYQALQVTCVLGKIMQVAIFEKKLDLSPDVMNLTAVRNLTLAGLCWFEVGHGDGTCADRQGENERPDNTRIIS